MKKSIEKATRLAASAALIVAIGGPATAEAANYKKPKPSIARLASKAISISRNAENGKGGPGKFSFNEQLRNGNTATVTLSSAAVKNGAPDPTKANELDVSIFAPQDPNKANAKTVDSVTFTKVDGKWNANHMVALPGAPDSTFNTEIIGQDRVNESVQTVRDGQTVNTLMDIEYDGRAAFSRLQGRADQLLDTIAEG